MLKNQNQNEKYLLKFISNPSNSENELLKLLYNFGCTLKFKNYNPVYQIIDELTYSKYLSRKS